MSWQRELDGALRGLGLTHTQFLVLLSLEDVARRAGEGVPQRAIAEEAGLDQATTSRIAKALAKRGLLDRGEAYENYRVWSVVTTHAGTRLLEKAKPLAEAAARRFFARGTLSG
jgi:DNA-binding MarR family transcriptional regulator